MSKIVRHTRPEEITIPTQQQNAFPSVLAISTALLASTAAVVAAAAHTAHNREQAGIVVVCAIVIWQTTIALTKIIKINRLIESKPFPEVNGG